MAVATYTVADAKTDQVAVSGKYRTLLPTDVTAATLADLGGAHQTGSFTIAANATPRQAQFSVTTTPNTAVDGDRSFDVEIYDVTPSGTTLTVSKVRTKIVDDDSAGGGSTVVYGPQNTGDTNKVAVGSTSQLMEHTFKNGKTAGIYMLGLDDNGNGYALFQQSDNRYQLRVVTAYSVGDVNNGQDSSVLPNSSINLSFADNDKLGFQIISGKANILRNDVPFSDEYGTFPYTLPSSPALGQNARYKKYFGDDVIALKIIRK